VLDCAKEMNTHKMNIKAQYEILRNELDRFSSSLKTRPFGIVISKVDIMQDNINDLICDIASLFKLDSSCLKLHKHIIHNAYINPIFASSLDMVVSNKSNDTKRIKQCPKSTPKKHIHLPDFICAISSVAHINTASLAHLLYQSIQHT